MKTIKLTVLAVLFTTICVAQETYHFASGGFDPKMAFIGTDNQYTKHGTGLDYFGKIGLRLENKEVSGYIEVFDNIGYRAIGLQFSHVEQVNSFDFLLGLETSIISRREVYDNGLNVKWQEYLPSFGINGEVRWNINDTFAIGYFANFKTRPDLLPYKQWDKRILKFSTYVQFYIKL